MPHTSDCF